MAALIAKQNTPRLIFPTLAPITLPSADLPDDVRADYLEAREIAGRSPRGAAALLRLGVQKLCVYLGLPGKDLNADIGALVGRGLPQKVQQALDSLRVVGNNAVHPGTLDLRDDFETAARLFELLNLIADVMISQPKRVESLYDKVLTPGQKDQIERRDAQDQSKAG